MSEYSVKTINRFALTVDEDEDLYELLQKKEEEKKKKQELAAEQAAKAKAAAAKSSKGDKKNSAKSKLKRDFKATENINTQNTVKPTSYRNDENRPPRFSRQNRDGPNENLNFEKPPQDFSNNRERRGGFRGRGGRGGGGGFGGGNRNRREYERHSGSDKTGIKAVEKRDGSGPHNWGDEIQAQLDQPEDQQKLDTTTEQQENTTENDMENGDVNVEAVEEAPKEMTLDEWKAAQKSTKAKTEFKVRKANEGADTKQWKNTVALQKKKKGDTSDEEDEEYTDDEEVDVDETKATLEKLNIEIRFSDSGRGMKGGRGGRGGRGTFNSSRGPRAGSRGGRGGFDNKRGGASHQSAPLVDNEAEFPTLGS